MKKIVLAIMALVLALNINAQTSTNDGYYLGDINSDTNVDIQDVALMIKVLKGEMDATKACYMKGGNDVTLDDLNELVNVVLGKSKKTLVNADSIPSAGHNNHKDDPLVAESKTAH